MCARFTRYLPWSEVHRLYRLPLDWKKQRNDAPAFNVAPTDQVPSYSRRERRPPGCAPPAWCSETCGLEPDQCSIQHEADCGSEADHDGRLAYDLPSPHRLLPYEFARRHRISSEG